ncbi:MAG: hypothetical protein FWG65_05155 [Turicibacter sp.]|nr:hypothetical protein [Turicibacter sp.]
MIFMLFSEIMPLQDVPRNEFSPGQGVAIRIDVPNDIRLTFLSNVLTVMWTIK